MMSITSVCITLCLVFQSAIVASSPQGRGSSKVSSEDNKIKRDHNGLNATQPSKSLSDIDISNLIGDKEVATFARAFVESVDSCSHSGPIFRQIELNAQPGNHRAVAMRHIMNYRVIVQILRGFYEEFQDRGEKLSFSYDFSAATKYKIKQALVNGLVKSLKPKPCLREFVRAFFEDKKINEWRFRGTSCDVNTMYNSQWYQREWKAAIVGSDAADSNRLCIVSTKQTEKRSKMLVALFNPVETEDAFDNVVPRYVE